MYIPTLENAIFVELITPKYGYYGVWAVCVKFFLRIYRHVADIDFFLKNARFKFIE